MNYNSISIASDHAGYEYKQKILNYLSEKYAQLNIEDCGTHSSESMDYPDTAHLLAQSIENNKSELGIILCGSGNGVCMTVNKHKKVRGALCWNEEIVELARKHNNANVLCLPARFISIEHAIKFIEIFMNTSFEGGRHLNRIEKI